MTNLHNVAVFDACVKSGIGSAKLVAHSFNFDSPSPGQPGVPNKTISPRRVFCFLSCGELGGKNPHASRFLGFWRHVGRGSTATQRTGGGSLKERGGVYGVGKLPTVGELLVRLNHTVRFTRIYEPHTMRGASLAVGPNCCRSLSKNTRTNGRTAIRKGVPASLLRASCWNFRRFRQQEVIGNPVASGTWHLLSLHVIPPRVCGDAANLVIQGLLGLYGTGSSQDWRLQISRRGDESVVGDTEQSLFLLLYVLQRLSYQRTLDSSEAEEVEDY